MEESAGTRVVRLQGKATQRSSPQGPGQTSHASGRRFETRRAHWLLHGVLARDNRCAVRIRAPQDAPSDLRGFVDRYPAAWNACDTDAMVQGCFVRRLSARAGPEAVSRGFESLPFRFLTKSGLTAVVFAGSGSFT